MNDTTNGVETHTDAVRADAANDPIQKAATALAAAQAHYASVLAGRAAEMAGSAVLGVLHEIGALHNRIVKLEAEIAALRQARDEQR
jgi:hypothetical protein